MKLLMMSVFAYEVRHCLRAVLLACVLPLIGPSACSASEPQMNSDSTLESALESRNLDRGMAKVNPDPVKARRIVVTLEDAPGPFAFVEGKAQYNVMNNDECGHINESAGVIERIVNFEAVPMTKVSGNEYKGVVYFDLMQDEDYYGRGVCRWELSALRINMRATGGDGETWFGPLIMANQIMSGEASGLYFWKGGYPRYEMDNYPDSGSVSRDKFKPEIRGDLFKVIIRAEGES